MSPPPPRIEPEHPKRAVFLLIAAVVAIGALSLGSRDLWPPDEPKYALVAQEMVQAGQWLVPHVNGAPYPDKPPLLFWLIAMCSAVTGRVSQGSAVMPSVLAGAAVLAGTLHLARRVDPAGRWQVGLVACALLGTSYRFIQQLTVGQIDMLLCATTTWAFALLWPANDASPARKRWKVPLAFALMALGTLAKGPVALILPLAGCAVAGWIVGGSRQVRRTLLSWSWLIYIAIVGAWIAPAAVWASAHGHEAWTRELLFDQTLVRYARSWHHHRPFWYLFSVPWYDFLPAIALAPGAIYGLFASQADAGAQRRRRALALACLLVVLFFSIPAGKRSIYLLPMYPWLACWLALDVVDRWPHVRRSLRIAAGVLSTLLSGIGLWLSISIFVSDERVAQWAAPTALSWLAFCLVAVAVTLIPLAVGRFGALAIRAHVVSWLVFYAVGVGLVLPAFNERRSARLFVEQVHAVTTADSMPAMIDFRAQFGFHAGRMQTAQPRDDAQMQALADALGGSEPMWVIVREKHVSLLRDRLGDASGIEAVVTRTVGNNRYVALANRAARRIATNP